MPTDPLYEACVRYLSDKQATLWADWDLTSPDRLHAAARWLQGQVQGVAEAAVYALPAILTEPYLDAHPSLRAAQGGATPSGFPGPDL